MTKEPNYALDAYDLGRMDMNERFLRILNEGIKKTNKRRDLIGFIEKELNSLGLEIEMEGMGNEQI